MAAGDGALFGSLPEQLSPAGTGGAAPRLRRAERRQVELRAVSLDALVADDHRVRLVWRFVEGLDLTAACCMEAACGRARWADVGSLPLT